MRLPEHQNSRNGPNGDHSGFAPLKAHQNGGPSRLAVIIRRAVPCTLPPNCFYTTKTISGHSRCVVGCLHRAMNGLMHRSKTNVAGSSEVEIFRGPFVSRLGAICPFEIGLSCVQLVAQGLGLFQIKCVEALGEQAVDW